MDIKPGDIVELKSGGPQMVVLEEEEDRALCQWFDKTTDVSKWFYKIALQHPQGIMMTSTDS